MRYKEFKEKIEDWGRRFLMDLNWKLYRNLSDDAKRELFKTLTEFAATKPEEREDEKEIQTNAEDAMNWKYIVGKGIWI